MTRQRAIDARAAQCRKFDNNSFNGYFFTWVPYLKGERAKVKVNVAGGMQLRTFHHKNYAVLLKEVNAVIEEMSFNVFALLEINHT